jgi:hypothetical protein
VTEATLATETVLARPCPGYNDFVNGRSSILAMALLVSGCVDSPVDTGPSTAVITLTISPVVVTATCPSAQLCLANIDATVTLAETAGLGGRVQGFDVVVRNKDTGVTETTLPLGADWVREQNGTDRLEPMGKMAFRPVVKGFPISTNGSKTTRVVMITAKVLDDKGNTLTQSAGLEIVPTG